MSWTDERIDRLKALWSEGNTASQIADDLGGVSRNAVIGKAHRLGLAARPSPVKASEPKDKLKAELVVEPAPPPELETQEEEQAEPAFGPAGIAPADAAGLEKPPASVTAPEPAEAPQPRVVSVGPGGFLRQGPGDQQAPIPPAPPRRLVPAKPSAEVSHKTFTFAARRRTRDFRTASIIAASPTRRSSRAATAARRPRYPSAVRAFARRDRPLAATAKSPSARGANASPGISTGAISRPQ